MKKFWKAALMFGIAVSMIGCTINKNKKDSKKIKPGDTVALTKENYFDYFDFRPYIETYGGQPEAISKPYAPYCIKFNADIEIEYKLYIEYRFYIPSKSEYEYVYLTFETALKADKVSEVHFGGGRVPEFYYSDETIPVPDTPAGGTLYDKNIYYYENEIIKIDGVIVFNEYFYSTRTLEVSKENYVREYALSFWIQEPYSTNNKEHPYFSLGTPDGGPMIIKDFHASFEYISFNPDYSIKEITTFEFEADFFCCQRYQFLNFKAVEENHLYLKELSGLAFYEN